MRRLWNYLRTWLIITKKRLFRLADASKGEDYTRFAIICAPRSGSTMLHTYLNSHNEVLSHGEIIRIKLQQGIEEVSIDEYVFMPISKIIKAVGLKLFYEYQNMDGYNKVFEEVLNDSDINVIHLMRKDIRKQFASLRKAEETGVWSSTLKKNEGDEGVNIPDIEYKEYEDNQKAIIQSVKERLKNHQVIEVYYEDLVDDPKVVLDNIQDFIKVDKKPLFTLLQKQGSK